METNYYYEKNLTEAADLIRGGELVAFPTETVYGLGADATNAEAVKAVYQAKNRPSDNPLIVHVATVETVLDYVDNLPAKAEKLIETFWPGPLTLIFEVKKGSLPSVVTGGLSTASFRMPNNILTLELIHRVGRPLVGPSANTSGKPSPTTAQHVYHDLKGKIAGILDDGPTSVGLESTVLDMSCEVPVILRPGAVTQTEIERVIGEIEIDAHLVSERSAPKSPGMKYKHYAPDVKVMLIDWQKNNWQAALAWAELNHLKAGLLANQQVLTMHAEKATASYALSEEENVLAASQQLFAGLRALDELSQSLDVIFVETYPEEGYGLAYMNRLKKAANQVYFKN